MNDLKAYFAALDLTRSVIASHSLEEARRQRPEEEWSAATPAYRPPVSKQREPILPPDWDDEEDAVYDEAFASWIQCDDGSNEG